MTARRPVADRNTGGPKSGLSIFGTRGALLTLRAAVILACGLIAGVLTYLAPRKVAGTALAGITA